MTTLSLAGRGDSGIAPCSATSAHAPRPALKITLELIFHDVDACRDDVLDCLRQVQSRSPDVVLLDARQRDCRRWPGGDARMRGLETVPLARLRETVAGLCARMAGDGAESPDQDQDRIPMKIGQRTYLVPAATIVAVVAQRNYVDVHTADRTYTVRCSLAAFAALLDRRRFLRLHRSLIVRGSAVREARLLGSGRYDLALAGGRRVRSGRSYRDEVRRLLGQMRGSSGPDAIDSQHPAASSPRIPRATVAAT